MKNKKFEPTRPYKPDKDALGRELNDPPFEIDDALALESIMEVFDEKKPQSKGNHPQKH